MCLIRLAPCNIHISRQLFRKGYSSISISQVLRISSLTRRAKSTVSAPRKMKEKKPKPRLHVPDYCEVETAKDEEGKTIWPAPADAMERARAFIRECAQSGKPTLLVPDKDADGLSSGVILHRTLTALGLPADLISTHIVSKGSSIHDSTERDLMSTTYHPSYIIVLDQGSRAAPRIIDNPSTKSLILDHHLSDSFPEDALVVSACHYPPVATTSLLTYLTCLPIHPSPTTFTSTCAYLACIGTHGDLGNTLKWLPPFPDLTPTLKQHSKTAITSAVSLLNAPRRTALYDVSSAWTALLSSTSPKSLLTNRRLLFARAEINAEVERHTHSAPKFTPDGRIAVLRIHTPSQVHPVIATRWAGYLTSAALEIVLVANTGYLPGMVNFSCRIARCARARAATSSEGDNGVNIIESLKAAAGLSTDGLAERLGESFARGHREASGGIVPTAAFEELMVLLRVGEKVEKKAKAKADDEMARSSKRTKVVGGQRNTLGNYFRKKEEEETGT